MSRKKEKEREKKIKIWIWIQIEMEMKMEMKRWCQRQMFGACDFMGQLSALREIQIKASKLSKRDRFCSEAASSAKFNSIRFNSIQFQPAESR